MADAANRVANGKAAEEANIVAKAEGRKRAQEREKARRTGRQERKSARREYERMPDPAFWKNVVTGEAASIVREAKEKAVEEANKVLKGKADEEANQVAKERNG